MHVDDQTIYMGTQETNSKNDSINTDLQAIMTIENTQDIEKRTQIMAMISTKFGRNKQIYFKAEGQKQ